MDVASLARMIEWLDEERRRDKQTIITLEERLRQQSESVDVLQRRLSTLESDNSVVKEKSLTIQREGVMIDQVRGEVRTLIEAAEARRLNAEHETELRAERNREGLVRSIRELTEQVEKIQKSTTLINELKSEEVRLSDILKIMQDKLDDLVKQIESPERRISLIEEQRRQDMRRLSQIETDSQDLRTQISGVLTKIPLIEDLSLRNERRIQEVQQGDIQRREQIQQFIDSQRLTQHQYEQQIETLMKKFGEQDSEMARNMERFEQWSQTYREMARIVSDFDRMSDRVERRIAEVAEVQRLSEERFRGEWNAWRDEEQKRWKNVSITQDDIWRNHDKEFGLYTARLAEIEEALPGLLDNLKRLWGLAREQNRIYREHMTNVLNKYDPETSKNLSSTGTFPAVTPPNNGIQNE